ncbi:MAG: bifunctional 2-C-methyl-D-erythritol 4-phosphate cytidylyltransferase/2-C-methyl-D-erythritol 2,4-cyclodiphosphate synthase [Hyphomicrobiales bacterium]
MSKSINSAGSSPKATVDAVLVAAGTGQRAGTDGPAKQFVRLGGSSMLARCIEALARCNRIRRILVVINASDNAPYRAAIADLKSRHAALLTEPATGGENRQQSVFNGLAALASNDPPDLALIHDAARPFVSPGLTAEIIARLHAGTADGVVPVMPVTDTIKRLDGSHIAGTVDRSTLFAAQTPQGFRFHALLAAHERAARQKITGLTDDASVAEWAGLCVATLPGEPGNWKVTSKDDLHRADALFSGARPMNTAMTPRTGLGFDVHRFTSGDQLHLCGVAIPFHKSLAGHSDADVALHALTDAIYGAIGEGDVGQHFPPSEEKWAGMASSHFLAHAVALVAERGARLVHVDLTIICEAPKIGPHRAAMIARLAEILGIANARISVKATTTETLGFTGRGEGIAAQAVATILALDEEPG